MKKLIVCFVLTMVIVGGVLAQERQGYIKPTFGAGYANCEIGVNSENHFGMLSMDVNFVSSIGLTLGLQTAMLWNPDDEAHQLIAFGIGYIYNADDWSAGATALASPFNDGGLGLNIIGTWWLNNNLGISGLFTNYFSFGDIGWNLLSIRFGISLKL
jgi:hypothetical protein